MNFELTFKEIIQCQEGLLYSRPDFYLCGRCGDPSMKRSRLLREIPRRRERTGAPSLDPIDIFADVQRIYYEKLKVIWGALGCFGVAFTLDICSHIIEGMQSDATALLDEVLAAATDGTVGKACASSARIASIMAGSS